jgi:hypothetical protein
MSAYLARGLSALRLAMTRIGASCTLAAVISVNPNETWSTVARSRKNGMNVLS